MTANCTPSQISGKIKAISSSIHLIAADIETEIAPIVGTKEQAEDLIKYINVNDASNSDGMLDTNIFGKTITSDDLFIGGINIGYEIHGEYNMGITMKDLSIKSVHRN